MNQVVSTPAGVAVVDVPSPTARPGQILVQVEFSCVSPGSELAAAASHQESILRKLRSRPEKALAVWRLLRSNGVAAVKERVAQQTEEFRALGYSVCGRVVDAGVSEFRVGERVACAGSGFAVHASYVVVPQNLVCGVPDGVSSDAASSVALGAIALQGLRRAELDSGSNVAVIGLGAVGQLTARLAAAAGHNVWVSDLNAARVSLATSSHPRVRALSGSDHSDYRRLVDAVGGLDAVIITAASAQAGLLDDAARRTRTRGRLIVVGDFPVHATRELLYAKELEIRLSCSYGPGRYDPSYEESAIDYPPGFVRWTANRNMQAYLECIRSSPELWTGLWPQPRPVSEASSLFADLSLGSALLGVLAYPPEELSPTKHLTARTRRRTSAAAPCRIGVIGSGEFTRLMHLPNLATMPDVQLRALATRSTLVGKRLAGQYGVDVLTSDASVLLSDPAIDAVLITVRHHEHASLVTQALRAGKHVLVEKPLAITENELEEIVRAADGASRGVMVAFNRRFSPAMADLQKQMPASARAVLHYRFSAGVLPASHWVNGVEGGGRIVGEACHAIDFVEGLLGPIASARIEPVGTRQRGQEHASDVTLTIAAARGIAHVSYTASTPGDGAKERVELSVDGRTSIVEDFRRFVARGHAAKYGSRPNKGHLACLRAFVDGVRGEGKWPIEFDSIVRTSGLSIAAQQYVDLGQAGTWTAL